MRMNGYWLVGAGAALWGTIGLFVSALQQLGFSSLQIVFLRTGLAGLILLVYTLLANPRQLRLSWRDLPYFLGTGICSMAFFNWCYFQAIKEVSLSVAAVLLYTGPAFVVILSRIFLKEALTPLKIISLLATFLGCCLVVGWLPDMNQNITLYGLILGLGWSGLWALQCNRQARYLPVFASDHNHLYLYHRRLIPAAAGPACTGFAAFGHYTGLALYTGLELDSYSYCLPAVYPRFIHAGIQPGIHYRYHRAGYRGFDWHLLPGRPADLMAGSGHGFHSGRGNKHPV